MVDDVGGLNGSPHDHEPARDHLERPPGTLLREERAAGNQATLYGLIERGEIAHTRVVNSIRMFEADVDAYLAAKRRPARRRSRDT